MILQIWQFFFSCLFLVDIAEYNRRPQALMKILVLVFDHVYIYICMCIYMYIYI